MSRSITLPTASDLFGNGGGRRMLAGILVGAVGVAAVGQAVAPPKTRAVDNPPATSSPTTPEHSITVAGTGTVTLSPDVADLRIGVSMTRPTVKAAREAAAEAMTGVLAALHKVGVADKDITTSTISLQPTYDYSPGGGQSKITGYQLQNMVLATIRNLDNVGPAIDGSTAAGATSIDGISFRVDDPTGAERQARTSAMSDAKARADALAAAAGVSIVGVSSINETVAPSPYPEAYKGFAAARPADGSVPTPVQPGTSEVTISVTVVYEIS